MLGALTPRRGRRGLTLIELLVVVAVVGVLAVIAAPSLRDFILVQRLKSIQSELVNDLQFARSEATSRNQFAHFRVIPTNAALTCYVIYLSAVNAERCDCTASETSTCQGNAVALRTVRIPRALSASLRLPANQAFGFAFDHISGGIVSTPSDASSTPLARFRIDALIDTNRVIRTTVSQPGRVSACTTAGPISGVPAC